MSAYTNTNYFDKLPTEMILNICSFLTIKETARLAQTCKRLHNIAQETLFKKLLLEQIEIYNNFDHLSLKLLFGHEGSLLMNPNESDCNNLCELYKKLTANVEILKPIHPDHKKTTPNEVQKIKTSILEKLKEAKEMMLKIQLIVTLSNLSKLSSKTICNVQI